MASNIVLPTFRSHADIVGAMTIEHGITIGRCGPQVDSMQAFMDHADQSKGPGAVREFLGCGYMGADWYGTSSWQEAIDRLRFGWREGMARVEKIRANITAQLPRATKTVYQYRPSVAPIGGLRINYHDIITGGPEPFIGRFKTQQEVHGRRIVKVAVNSCYSAGVSTRVAEARGAAIMALIQQFQLAKMTVDLTIVFPCGMSNWVSTWHVAPAGYPINNDQLAYALISASALRRMGHAMHAYLTGRASYMPAPLRRVAPELAKTFDIVIESDVAYSAKGAPISAEWSSEKGQIEWIKNMMQAEGIKVS